METDSSEEEEEQPVRIPLGHRPVVFAVPGSEELAARASHYLGWQRGLCSFSTFDNGEISVKIEETVTNHDVFVFFSRSDSAAEPAFSLMQLMFCINALKGESPYRLTVVMPCLEYARQDRKMDAGRGIPVQLVLRCMKRAGADRYLTLDLHNEAQVAFAPQNTVLDELCARRYLAAAVRHALGEAALDRAFVCATSGGGMTMTRRMAAELCIGFMMVDHMRPKAGGRGELKIQCSEPPERVESVIVVDDIFDTCGSLAKVCRALHAFAPRAKLYAVASHGYFSSFAHTLCKELVNGCNLQWLAVTNSVEQSGSMQRFCNIGLGNHLRVIDISRLLAGAAMRIYLGASVNQPRFRDIGPKDHDPVLQTLTSPRIALARRSTEEGGRPPGPPPMRL
mmetsp:Transcript_57599/g.166748  ORF Transcript_57599/g.166748 Transcript_57599/m.166748 type:complete len:395 (-) Transcript_57599:58-1242(-)